MGDAENLPLTWVATALGEVPVWGDFAGRRPIVLVIRGAFPLERMMEDLTLPGVDMVFLHLPGFYSPTLQTHSIGAFVFAFEQVIRQLLAGRDIIVLGLSAGALVALGLRSPEVKSVVAVEPFFSTAQLWPLIQACRGLMVRNPNDAAMRAWLQAVFGYTADRIDDRDYRAVLEPKPRAVHAIVGADPLHPQRPYAQMPSLTDEADRERLRASGARMHLANAGHDIPAFDLPILVRVLNLAIKETRPGR